VAPLYAADPELSREFVPTATRRLIADATSLSPASSPWYRPRAPAAVVPMSAPMRMRPDLPGPGRPRHPAGRTEHPPGSERPEIPGARERSRGEGAGRSRHQRKRRPRWSAGPLRV